MVISLDLLEQAIVHYMKEHCLLILVNIISIVCKILIDPIQKNHFLFLENLSLLSKITKRQIEESVYYMDIIDLIN